jgi:hypothetical protein
MNLPGREVMGAALSKHHSTRTRLERRMPSFAENRYQQQLVLQSSRKAQKPDAQTRVQITRLN